jgi:aminopeptidase N
MKKLFLIVSFVALTVSLAAAQRLPKIASPDNYKLHFVPNLEKATFDGDETISLHLLQPTAEITLNAADIEFHEATISSGGTTQKANVTLDQQKEMAVLKVAKPLAAGPATIHIAYSGVLNNEMRGFYLGQDDHGRRYAATQFESTDARRAFPSFDEPEYKATFDISVVVDKDMTAISNQKVDSDTPTPTDKRTVTFATTAKMSSYLAALVVGHFEYVEGEVDGIPIRVYSSPGKKEMGQFALEVSQDVVKYFDNYFGIKYPYGKLDLIGIPDFSAGAMENTGCITFREALLLVDSNRGSVDTRKFIASVISHEIAHQWFGDLVTMKWWNDVWLNEGFATWLSSKPIEAFKPQWQVDLDDVSAAGKTLNLDSLDTTRPIHQDAETPAEIDELFDGIAYGKAAAVLRMLEAYLGEESFRTGVSTYLKEHEYANATAEDFWDTLAKTSKKPVDKIMPTWVNQAGVPIVYLKSECSGTSTTVTLSQQRYYYDRAKLNEPNDELWQIPMCLKGSTDAKAPRCELLTRKEESFTLPGCSTWVLGNAGATGYYRVGYEPDAVHALSRDVEDKLTAGERIGLETDIWASMRIEREPVGDYLAIAQGLQLDTHDAVIFDVLTRLRYIGDYLVGDGDRDAYRTWLRRYLTPAMEKVGWEPNASDSDEQKDLRSHLFDALGHDARDPEALAEARKMADKALADPSSLDHDLAGEALELTALNGNVDFYDKVTAAIKATKSPEVYYLYLYTLPEFSDPKLIERTLNYAVSPEVRSQDALRLISQVFANPAGQQLAWDFVRQHWSAVENAGGPFAVPQIVAATGVFCSARMRDEVVEFFNAHKVDGAERTYRQTIERINTCIDLKSHQESQIASWLGEHGTAGGK